MINITSSTKVCTKCASPKNISEFSKKSSTNDGLNCWCRSCMSEYNLSHYASNKEKINNKTTNYRRNKRQLDPIYKLQKALRDSLYRYLKHKRKMDKIKIIGCDWEELKHHIESQFQDGMSWDNWSKDGWHIDHIIPLASATNEDEMYKLNHYTNLQPLWSVDNLHKGNRIK